MFILQRHKPAGTRNRIIPHDEDIRRLFQECKMAVGNATLLSEALLTCTPSSLKNNAIIKEFHKKCENSQKLIFAQIEWATAQAEHSRVRRNAERGADETEGREVRDKERESRKKRKDGDDETTEEKLLGALLGANEELLSALRQYDDLAQILVEKKSRKDVRMGRRVRFAILLSYSPLIMRYAFRKSPNTSSSSKQNILGSPRVLVPLAPAVPLLHVLSRVRHPPTALLPLTEATDRTSVMPTPSHTKEQREWGRSILLTRVVMQVSNTQESSSMPSILTKATALPIPPTTAHHQSMMRLPLPRLQKRLMDLAHLAMLPCAPGHPVRTVTTVPTNTTAIHSIRLSLGITAVLVASC
jgi:hypothetical protein